MRAAAARRRDPAVAPRLCRSGVRCREAVSAAVLDGEGMSCALNSTEVNCSHSREREKWGAWLCRLASEVASATRPCMHARRLMEKHLQDNKDAHHMHRVSVSSDIQSSVP